MGMNCNFDGYVARKGTMAERPDTIEASDFKLSGGSLTTILLTAAGATIAGCLEVTPNSDKALQKDSLTYEFGEGDRQVIHSELSNKTYEIQLMQLINYELSPDVATFKITDVNTSETQLATFREGDSINLPGNVNMYVPEIIGAYSATLKVIKE